MYKIYPSLVLSFPHTLSSHALQGGQLSSHQCSHCFWADCSFQNLSSITQLPMFSTQRPEATTQLQVISAYNPSSLYHLFVACSYLSSSSSLFPLIFSVSDPQPQVQFFNCPPWFLRYGLSLGQGAQPRDLSLLPQTWYYKCKPPHLYVGARIKPKGSLVCVGEALYLLGSIPSPGLVFYLCPL